MPRTRAIVTSLSAMSLGLVALGCSTPKRNAVPPEHIRDASPPGMESWRITRDDAPVSEGTGVED